MVKHTQTIRLQQPTNCLSVFDHFVGLALKELIFMKIYQKNWDKVFLKNIYISLWQLLFAPLDKKCNAMKIAKKNTYISYMMYLLYKNSKLQTSMFFH